MNSITNTKNYSIIRSMSTPNKFHRKHIHVLGDMAESTKYSIRFGLSVTMIFFTQIKKIIEIYVNCY